MNAIEKIKTMKNTIDLDNFVTAVFETEYQNDDFFISESYAETADRIEDDNPELAEILRFAEKKWFEIGGR